MSFLNSKTKELNKEYETVELVKKSKRGSISVIRKIETGDRFILRSFEGKSQVYKKLMEISSPNLPKIYGVEEQDGFSYVLEEYVCGDTLYDILCGGILSEEEAAKIILDLCDALKVLHGINIVHRDIKPENVIIRGSEAVLIDFDASRMVNPEKDTDTRILGTTGFAAPEQYGISQTDARADIYSLGVMLNVMLTGEHPSIKLAPGGYGDIVQKCTMINPDKRYQNSDEIVKSILRKRKLGKKQRKTLFAAVPLLIAAVIAFAFFLPKAREEEKTEEILPTEEEKISVFGWDMPQGESEYLPEEFYDYWSPEEFVRPEQIKINLPGNLEEHISYRFSEDILDIVIHNIPDEDYEKAGQFNPGDELYVEIEIEAPSDDISEVIYYRGNGPTYSYFKKQQESGEKIYYSTFNPETDIIITNRPFAKIVSIEGKNKASLYESGSVFYAAIGWKDSEGNVEAQVIPYRILTANDAKTNYGYDFWMDTYWEPIEDKERIVFREVYNHYKFYTEDEIEENGISLDVFEVPGVISTDTGNVSGIDIEKIANAEAYLLPPDYTPRQEGETIGEWLDRTAAESKYIGFKINHSTGAPREFANNVHKQEHLDVEPFFYTNDHHTRATNILEMRCAEVEGTTIWTTVDSTKDVVMVIDWYTEDLNQNPSAKPAKREYLCTEVEPFIYYDSENIIAGGYCGNDEYDNAVIWTLNTEGTLRISGKGAMEDYSESGFNRETQNWHIEAPWGEYAEKCQKLIIDEGITVIGAQAFAGMTNLTGKLELPVSVKEIKTDAFLGCGFDSELTIPQNVKSIGESAFAQWRNGEKGVLTVNEGLEHLGSNAFSEGNFTAAKLPSTLRDMGASVFDDCRFLEEITISSKNKDLCVMDGVIYTKDMKILVEVPYYVTGELTVPDGVEIIGLGAFQKSNAEKVILPKSVKEIKRAAFHAYEGKIIIKGELDIIEDFAFYPGSDKKIEVRFESLPPKEVFAAHSETPSFCEYLGKIKIYAKEENQGEWTPEGGFWNGYKIKFY